MENLKQKLRNCKSEKERLFIVSDLSNANLSNADLSDADLSDANLRYANLRNADMNDANLSGITIRICGKWAIQIHSEKEISIGCKKKLISEWNKFFKSKEVIETKRDTFEFKEIQLNFEYAKIFIKKYKGQFEDQK